MKNKNYAICIQTGGYVDLELMKEYVVQEDPVAILEGYIRIIDESGEDYLYPTSYFSLIKKDSCSRK